LPIQLAILVKADETKLSEVVGDCCAGGVVRQLPPIEDAALCDDNASESVNCKDIRPRKSGAFRDLQTDKMTM